MLLGAGSTDYLIDLWINTATNHPDGALTGMDAMDVALEAGWEDDPDKFVSAMIQAGFLDQDDKGTYHLHDWGDHQPWVVESDKRSAKAKKAAEARWSKAQANHSPSDEHATSMQQASTGHANSNAPAFPAFPAFPEDLKNKNARAHIAKTEPKDPIPASPEDNPDAQPNANVSDLSECLIEFQDIAAVFQDAGGYVDTVTAYSTFLPMRFNFPRDRVVDDIATRGQSDAWKRQDIPTKLSTYLSRRMWLDGNPSPRASPQGRKNGKDDDWMRYAGSCIKEPQQ